MREMWQLPKTSVRKRALRLLLAAAILWAVVALPVTAWLLTRNPPPPPPPAQRALTVIDAAAVRYGADALRSEPVTLTSTAVSPAARLEVSETVDPVRGISHGSVASMSQTAELLVVGDRVLLRGAPAFWSTLGVSTSETGWVEVGDKLGVIPFPLMQSAAALSTAPQARIDTPADPSDPTTYRNGALTAVFGDGGLVSLSLGDRTASIALPKGDELSKLASVALPGSNTPIATLTGTVGALSIAPPPPPPGAPAPPAPAE